MGIVESVRAVMWARKRQPDQVAYGVALGHERFGPRTARPGRGGRTGRVRPKDLHWRGYRLVQPLSAGSSRGRAVRPGIPGPGIPGPAPPPVSPVP
jgi:hypothetical protein